MKHGTPPQANHGPKNPGRSQPCENPVKPMKKSLWRIVRRSLGLKNVITRDDLKHEVIHVEIDHAHGGFFAQLNWCLYIFAYAKANSVVPRVSLVSQNYGRGTMRHDWFQDYFRYSFPIRNEGVFWAIRKKRITDISELGFIEPDLTMQQAHNIFFETVSVRDPIREEVDNFVRHNYLGNCMLGIHYRGTDKASEAPRVTYERVERHLDDLLENGQFSGVFLASDEQSFIDFLLKKVSGVPIVAREDLLRSIDGNPLHRSIDGHPLHLGQPKSAIGKLGLDALVNCMLLARCHSILRTSSFLSAWSSIFNPRLHVYLLNIPYAKTLWFPEVEIMKSATLLSNANDDYNC